MTAAGSLVGRGVRGVAWFVRGVLREDAYERYLEHEASHGRRPTDPGVLTEREFWRDRTDRQDHAPEGRCC
ncbi:YbdD/YjiX family protein [Actinotalea ferrariae]|uniref:CstA-like transporter-associated (seleno)protein n=1 Tax=Actinotalea ferrariae TaxID=1386098 RepID=UPI001C8C231D|nr:YbdD/YjiX family protein [Actinotalea ferrariae]MBX9244745.1 YbdD/YjiX family protein [Actinotalea ferrariae]